MIWNDPMLRGEPSPPEPVMDWTDLRNVLTMFGASADVAGEEIDVELCETLPREGYEPFRGVLDSVFSELLNNELGLAIPPQKLKQVGWAQYETVDRTQPELPVYTTFISEYNFGPRAYAFLYDEAYSEWKLIGAQQEKQGWAINPDESFTILFPTTGIFAIIAVDG